MSCAPSMNMRLTHKWPLLPGLAPQRIRGEAARIFRRKHDTHHPHAVAQEAIHAFGEVRQLIYNQNVDFRALIFVDVLLVPLQWQR